MKLIKIYNSKTSPVYFTTPTLAAKYLMCSYQSINAVLKGLFKTIKGFHVEKVDVDLGITVNPTETYKTINNN